MSARTPLLVAALLLGGLWPCDARAREAGGEPIARAQQIETGLRAAFHSVLDVDRDGADDLLVVSQDGAVRVWRGVVGGFEEEAVGTLRLASPSFSLLAVGDVLGDGSPPQLAVLSPKGLAVYPVGEDGAFRRGGHTLVPRARMKLRVSAPRLSEILRDVNGDGRLDLIVPLADACELWLNDGPPDAAATDGSPALPRFRMAARFRVKTTRHRATRPDALSDLLEESFRVPSLRFSDVNGDGREDLLVGDRKRQAFHLQAADGSFPTEPDVEVDLKVFRDTTPEADVRPGETLAGERDARLETADLDLDGIPDYVIAHRRKVWVFHGTAEGPQFTEPTAVLKTADDVTAALLTHLDGDGRPDLLLLRLQVPTIGAVLRGLFAEWDVSLSFSGYENTDGRQFGRKPRWRSDVELRLPAIVGVLRDLEGFVQRFDRAISTLRPVSEGDLDGDGRVDLAIVGEDDAHVRVWFGTADGAEPDGTSELARRVFDASDQVWELDQVFEWFGRLGRRRTAVLTGGREPDVTLALRDGEDFERTSVQTAVRDGSDLLVVGYRRRDPEGAAVFDIYSISP